MLRKVSFDVNAYADLCTSSLSAPCCDLLYRGAVEPPSYLPHGYPILPSVPEP